MNKLNQQEINTSILFKTRLKIWLNWKKESKSYKINFKSWKIKALKNIKLFKIIIISNNLKFTKEIKQKLNLINMSWKRNKKKNLLTKISTKSKNWIWSFCLFKKTCKISGFNTNKPVKTETILVFNLSIEMTNFVSCIKNQMFNKIFSENPK